MPIYKQKERNKDGLYKYLVQVSYTDSYGNYKKLSRRVWGQQAARDMETSLRAKVSNKDTASSMTMDELYLDYQSYIKNEVRVSSFYSKSKNYYNYISPYAGKQNIKKLNVKFLEGWKAFVNGKNLAHTTKQDAFSEFRAVLNYAVRMEYLPSNPLSKVKNFVNAYDEPTKINFYTPEEFRRYKAVALSEAQRTNYFDYYVFFCTRYYTGARKGEIHALRWNCIEGEYLHIRKSISQKLKGGDMETPPKNKSSIRTIQIPLPLMEILNEHRTRQQFAINAVGQKWAETGHICGYYAPLRDGTIDNRNREYAKLAGLKKIRIHDFRHSHASLLINSGINALEVARRLGHSTVDQTLTTYAHLFPKESEKAIDVLNNIL